MHFIRIFNAIYYGKKYRLPSINISILVISKAELEDLIPNFKCIQHILQYGLVLFPHKLLCSYYFTFGITNQLMFGGTTQIHNKPQPVAHGPSHIYRLLANSLSKLSSG
jgi:hypothetical protein